MESLRIHILNKYLQLYISLLTKQIITKLIEILPYYHRYQKRIITLGSIAKALFMWKHKPSI